MKDLEKITEKEIDLGFDEAMNKLLSNPETLRLLEIHYNKFKESELSKQDEETKFYCSVALGITISKILNL